jgi:hypothetical protein
MMSKTESPTNKKNMLIIQGVTKEGRELRPSNWAERMCEALATLDGNRIHYDPRLVPMTNQQGYKCVILDPELQSTNPEAYKFVMEFVKDNQLVWCQEEKRENL